MVPVGWHRGDGTQSSLVRAPEAWGLSLLPLVLASRLGMLKNAPAQLEGPGPEAFVSLPGRHTPHGGGWLGHTLPLPCR